MIINYYFGFNEQVSLNKLGFCQEVSWPAYYYPTRNQSCSTVVLQLSAIFSTSLAYMHRV
jgi:hypothetical protein